MRQRDEGLGTVGKGVNQGGASEERVGYSRGVTRHRNKSWRCGSMELGCGLELYTAP